MNSATPITTNYDSHTIAMNSETTGKDAFVSLVEKCRENELPNLIENASTEHAATLFENLFRIAKDKQEAIKIVSGHLNPSFYDKFSSHISDCMQAGCNVEVIILNQQQKDFLDTHSFAATIKSKGGAVFVANESTDTNHHPHFVLIGSNRFRFEIDHSRTKAIASFNNESIGRTLEELFTSLKESILPQNTATAV